MSSIIEGYNYDIFISYRQNDNKYDGWVTEFINNLSKELEATIKNKINVYFDANLNDGLLETHLVSKSLEDKLKCLIFIPILSRTYCDPNSYAWNNEFLAFIKIAEHDRFGLNIKLSGSNFSSRILPVRIHDLDPEDIKLVENQLGFIRSVDFIYHSQGVNRPLRQKDDDVIQNIKQLIYRDQINKIANAIDEIIRGLKRAQAATSEEEKVEIIPSVDVRSQGIKIPLTQISRDKEPDSDEPSTEKPAKKKKKRIIYTSSSLVIVLAVIALYIFSSGSTLPFSRRDWIIITDFENLTENPVFDKSLYTAFTLSTSQSIYINVLPKSRMIETLKRIGINDMQNIDEKMGRDIALREGLNIYIVPGISEIGNKYAITAKILDAKTGDLLKSEILYADTQDDILATLDHLSKRVRHSLGESRYTISTQDKPLQKVTTSSLEALKLYSLGIEQHLKLDFTGARDYYQNALKIDTGFVSAKASLGSLLIEKFGDMNLGRELLNQALHSVNNLTEKEKLGILAFNASNVEKDLAKSVEYTKMRISLYPDDAIAHNNLGYIYYQLNQFEDAAEEYKVAIHIDPNTYISYSGLTWIYLEKLGKADSALVWSERMVSNNPQNVWGYVNLGAAWLCFDSLSRAEAAFIKAREINSDLSVNLFRLAHIYRMQTRYDEAIEILKNILLKNPDEPSANYDLGVNYQAMGNKEEAIRYFTAFKNYATEVWVKEMPDNVGTYIVMSAVNARLGNMESSSQMLQKAIEIDSTMHERYAELLCLQGKVPQALNQLERAFSKGYRNLFWLKLTPDLEALEYDIRFHNLLEKYFK